MSPPAVWTKRTLLCAGRYIRSEAVNPVGVEADAWLYAPALDSRYMSYDPGISTSFSITLLLECFIWIHSHCLLIGFHWWPTFCPGRPRLPVVHLQSCVQLCSEVGRRDVASQSLPVVRCAISNHPRLEVRSVTVLTSPCLFTECHLFHETNRGSSFLFR